MRLAELKDSLQSRFVVRAMLVGALAWVVILSPPAAVADEDDDLFAGHENWPTRKQAAELALDHARANDLATFKKLNSGASWYGSAVKFLEGCVLDQWDTVDAPSQAALEQLARGVYLDGCDDALFVAQFGRLLLDMNRSEAARPMFAHAAEHIKAQGYSGLAQARLQRDIWRLYSKRHGDQHKRTANQALSDMVLAVSEMIKPELFGEKHRPILTAELVAMIDDLPADASDRFVEAIRQAPRIDPVAAQTALGVHHIDAAWRARGGGFANTVTQEGWLGFGEHLKRAKHFLTLAYEADPTVPEAATYMVQVSMGLSESDQLIVWFQRAIKARFDQSDAYNRILNATRPRWGGDHRLMLALGEAARQTKRYDTDVPAFFLFALRSISLDIGGDYEIWTHPEILASVRDTVNGLVEANPDGRRNAEYLTHVVAAAYHAGEFKLARETIERLAGKHHDPTAEKMALHWQETVDEVMAMTGPAGEHFREARTHRKAGDHDKTLAALAKAERTVGDDQRARRHLAHVMQTAKWEKAFHQGEWVPLRFEKGFPGWSLRHGAWRLDGDGGAIGLATNGINLRCRGQFGVDWELKGRIDFVTKAGYVNAGVFLYHKEDYAWHGFHLLPHRNQAIVQFFWPSNEGRPVPLQEQNTIHLTVLAGHVTYVINDRTVFDRDPIPRFQEARPESVIGLGSFRPEAGNELRYSDLMIRKVQ